MSRARGSACAFVIALAACKSAPSEAQLADVRARFDHAAADDHAPDVAFRAALTEVRAATPDASPSSSTDCAAHWEFADRELYFQGLGKWGVEAESTDAPLASRLMQFDNVSLAGADVALASIGSASRARRQTLGAALLERKGATADLDGKQLMARADTLLTAPLPNELFIDLATSKLPTTKGETYKGGFASGRAYLFDHAAQRFICAGTFTAESSDFVDARVGRFSVNTDFYKNVVEAAKTSLHAL